MTDAKLINKLCLNFCPYYKPAKDEEEACKGFLIVERLLEKGKKITFERPDGTVGPSTVKTLTENLCIACSFQKNDCDFADEKENALPCGGFTFLGYLVDEKIITIDDIINTDYTFE